jgi:hypothetical protein
LPDAGTQLALSLAYSVAGSAATRRRLSEYGFSCYSQTDEDGILLYIFAVAGVTNRLCIEICAGDGIECNTANLIVNHGWHGLLVDGDEENVSAASRFYLRSRSTYVYPPRIEHAWVTRGNVNDIIRRHGFDSEVDLLSVDLDGVDYWIWDAITVAQPRVVVVEYQDILGPERSWTVPYSDDFDATAFPMSDGMPNFAGASLPAFVKLGRRKGYRLVGVNRYGYNAFFVRNGVAEDRLPEVDVAACFTHPKNIEGMRHRFPMVADLPWVQV